MARLVLVGLPGVGKSTLARAIADRWGCRAVDTDDLVEALVEAPAGAYLRAAGEGRFREVEREALAEALAADAVVATGAGVVVEAASRAILRDETTVWLDADDATLLARVADGDRPLLGDDPGAALARLRAERSAHYAEVADVRVEATGPLEAVLARVLEAVGA